MVSRSTKIDECGEKAPPGAFSLSTVPDKTACIAASRPLEHLPRTHLSEGESNATRQEATRG